MDFNLTYLQEELQSSARGMLARQLSPELIRDAEASADGFPRAVWDEACQLGWASILVGEEHGGGGGDLMDLSVLLEEVGLAAATLPLVISSGISATTLDRVPDSAARSELLGGIASGQIISPALVDEHARNEWAAVELPLRSHGDSYRLSGRKVFVPFASVADALLVTACDPNGELVLVVVDPTSDGVEVTRHDAAGGVPLFQVDFGDAAVREEQVLARGDEALGALHAGLEAASLLSTAEAVGLCEGVITMTADYVTNRVAFGRPIGSYQAVAHPCADMRVDTDAVRLLVREAAWLLSEGRPATVEILTTKAYANGAIERMVNDALRVHGAIGFSNEYDLQLYNRRLRAFCQAYGETDEAYERAAVAYGV